jgi:hypothetical protein
MSRKITVWGLLLASITLISCQSAQASLTWVNLSNPNISYLEENVYRFRVDVTWGGESYFDLESGTYVEPILDRLWIPNTLGDPVMWTGNHSGIWGHSDPGDWYGGVESPNLMGEFGLHGPEFGWDFTTTDPLEDSYTLNYSAFMAWLDYDYVNMRRIEGGIEEHTGQMVAMVIPEPGTVFLVGFGLLIAGYVIRRR